MAWPGKDLTWDLANNGMILVPSGAVGRRENRLLGLRKKHLCGLP